MLFTYQIGPFLQQLLFWLNLLKKFVYYLPTIMNIFFVKTKYKSTGIMTGSSTFVHLSSLWDFFSFVSFSGPNKLLFRSFSLILQETTYSGLRFIKKCNLEKYMILNFRGNFATHEHIIYCTVFQL